MDSERFEELSEYLINLKKSLKEMDLMKNIKKQKIKLAKKSLFQIPFIRDQIKLYEFKSYNCDKNSIINCALETLAILGLRPYPLCLQDSKRIIKMYDDSYDRGIYHKDISHYLSTIFDTTIEDKTHYHIKDGASSYDLFSHYSDCKLPYCKLPYCKLPYCKLPYCKLPYCKLPYCKLPYLDLKEGHATFICVKYFEPDDRLWGNSIIVYKYKGTIYYYDPTTNTNTVSIKKIMKKMETKQFEQYTCFYTHLDGAVLNKNKLVAPIRY
jgi:hypothetical protein